MQYIIEKDLYDFEAWSGAVHTLETLKEKGDCEAVEDIITETFDNPTETDINDFLWFECDYIAECLGYDSWEAYEKGDGDEDEDEE